MTVIDQLGYLAFEVSDLAAWRAFATNVLGLSLAREWAGGFSLRMDGHAQRIFVREGPADDLAAVGWQVADAGRLEQLAAGLRDAGHELHDATPDAIADRQVTRMFHLVDPGGLRTEVFCGPRLADQPFVSPVVASGFVADELGLGHVVLNAPDPAATGRFYRELLGFRLSDRIVCSYHGFAVDITFLHTNQRHHTLAFGGAQAKRLHHFLVETRSVNDVGLALDRTVRAGLRLAQTLGRHPNDKMLSFYAHTPSGFQFEFGCGGALIDDDTWQPQVHDCVSEWGHHPPQLLAPRRRGAP